MLRNCLKFALVWSALMLGACGSGSGGDPPQERGGEPSYPAADPQAVARYRKWQKENALPAVFLDPDGRAPVAAGGSRIGGAVWLAKGESWPADSKGEPMTFIAQVDFGEMPRLPDYPQKGVLQFFIGRDIYFGADFDHPEKGEVRVIWRKDFEGSGGLHVGKLAGKNGIDDFSPIEGITVTDGLRLTAHAGMSEPTHDSWLFARDLPDIAKVWVPFGVNAFLTAPFLQPSERSHVGGHPEFTQDDWRTTPQYQEVDRVLLNLWSNDYMMWGDMGQGQFLIRREDLLKRDFSKVYYQWDSG